MTVLVSLAIGSLILALTAAIVLMLYKAIMKDGKGGD